MIVVTAHAFIRFRERVADLPDDAIRAILNSRAILAAVAIGAPYVRLGTGQRVVIVNGRVVTVLPANTCINALQSSRDHLHGRRGIS